MKQQRIALFLMLWLAPALAEAATEETVQPSVLDAIVDSLKSQDAAEPLREENPAVTASSTTVDDDIRLPSWESLTSMVTPASSKSGSISMQSWLPSTPYTPSLERT